MKIVGSHIIHPNQLEEHQDYERVTIRTTVIKVHDEQKVGGSKLKQHVIVGDATSQATIALWENDVDRLRENILPT